MADIPGYGLPAAQLPSWGGANQAALSIGVGAPPLLTGPSLPQSPASWEPFQLPHISHLHNTFTLPGVHSSRRNPTSVGRRDSPKFPHEPSLVSNTWNAAQTQYQPDSTAQSAPVDWAVTTENEDGDGPLPQPSSRKARPANPSNTLWQQNKSHIEKLYMKEGLPLLEVRRLMERDHSFTATERMYKNKFKIWQWSKNLPQEKAIWMSRKVLDRRPLKKTVFYWNNQEWTEERLTQIRGKVLESQSKDALCAPTPDDIHYKTPCAIVNSPLTQISSPNVSYNRGKERAGFYLDSRPVNLDLSRTTITDLHRLLDGASRAASDGRIDDANADFRDAVSGFRHLLSPTNEETLRAGYLYASFYVNYADIDKAEAVLAWMSDHHLRQWGPEHERTQLHYARMVDLFKSWGLRDRAETIGYKILNGFQDDGSDLMTSFKRIGSEPHQLLSRSATNLGNSRPETDDVDTISRELDKSDMALPIDSSALENALKAIISRYEDQSGNPRMSLHICRAKCTLAKLYSIAARVVESHQTLKSARVSLSPLLAIRKEPMSQATIEAAKSLAYMFYKAPDEKSCNAILDEVIASLEARLYISTCENELENTILIDFVQSLAFHFHQDSEYDKCRYWAERGLGLAIRLFGRQSTQAERFEEMLKRDDFSMRAPMNVDNLMSRAI
ncbi:hypothetical protein F4803DRAFT_569713 [Xylaria telfairii]|nr:hypothetical protein F4803DRAFT_569713 [Xylaria telfairii]